MEAFSSICKHFIWLKIYLKRRLVGNLLFCSKDYFICIKLNQLNYDITLPRETKSGSQPVKKHKNMKTLFFNHVVHSIASNNPNHALVSKDVKRYQHGLKIQSSKPSNTRLASPLPPRGSNAVVCERPNGTDADVGLIKVDRGRFARLDAYASAESGADGKKFLNDC